MWSIILLISLKKWRSIAMIDEMVQQMILKLYADGKSRREISRILNISRNSVKKAITPCGQDNDTQHCDKHTSVESELMSIIKPLYHRCQGNVVRVQELLQEEYDKSIAYSTLTDWVRKYNLRAPPKRAGAYHFDPGLEMQHDTSPHTMLLDGKTIKAQCAALTLAYSRKLYMQYYPRFTRFEAQEFLASALLFMKGCCKRCIIDNTSVILHYGSGADAIICVQMERFGRMYGFEFQAHAINHPNRKARVERPFYYIERNFIPGRTFKSWEDLNTQAEHWCINVSNAKEKRSLGMSPEEAYIKEAPYLARLPKVLPPVYEHHQRKVDISGYINLESNCYSAPEKYLGKLLDVYKYPKEIKIFYKDREIASHARAIGVKNKRSLIKGHHQQINRHSNRALASDAEQQLRGHYAELDNYMDSLKKKVRGRGARKFEKLLDLQRTYSNDAFLIAVKQASKYCLYDLHRVEELIIKYVAGNYFNLSLTEEDGDE